MAKAIMILGTASNAGKSLITTGLCRIFSQDGYRVAPFKSQNMSLNSYITKDGLEMGRAQVAQAEAAGKAPDIRMNPILLKPTGESTSQVIVNGEVLKNMPAAQYYAYKQNLIPHIKKAYQSLAAENDIIVIEGAGSPAEINLKDNDIVNMGMAKMASAPVLLAGDIDRGGVFASLYGTVMLCDAEERRLIKGTLINKFRGDADILAPGLTMLFDLIGIPNLGIIPYSPFDIDDEDSLSGNLLQKKATRPIDIAAVSFPHVSNFTDLSALRHIKGASVRFISKTKEFGQPDFLILPGTKSTMADLTWLKDTGLADLILDYTKKGKPVFGICGGYQMLCTTLSDPQRVEGGGKMEGLGLLPADVVFETQKTRTQVTGRFMNMTGLLEDLNDTVFAGYEIHMGKTIKNGKAKVLSVLCDQNGEEKEDGLCYHNIFGSYVHGIFDSPKVLSQIEKILAAQKGVQSEEETEFDFYAYKQSQYDFLADTLRNCLDLASIYRIIDEGV